MQALVTTVSSLLEPIYVEFVAWLEPTLDNARLLTSLVIREVSNMSLKPNALSLNGLAISSTNHYFVFGKTQTFHHTSIFIFDFIVNTGQCCLPS